MKRFLALAAVIAVLPFVPQSVAIAGGGGCHGAYTPDAHGVSVRIENYCFDPQVIRVAKGGTVRWTNADATPHNLVGSGFEWGEFNRLGGGESISFRFDNDGVYPYACTLHPGMISAVVVGSGVRAPGAAPTKSAVTRSAVSASPADGGGESSSGAPAAAAAAPSTPPRVDAVGPASSAADRGGLRVAGMSAIAAIILAGVALLARRSPRERQLLG